MSSFNMPPGCNTSMIPGNSTEDELWERLLNWVCDKLAESSLRPEEVFKSIELLTSTKFEDLDSKTIEDLNHRMLETLYDV